MENVNIRSLSLSNRLFKRCFDISMSFIGLIMTGWIIILAFFFATIDTGKRGYQLHPVGVGKMPCEKLPTTNYTSYVGFEPVTTKH